MNPEEREDFKKEMKTAFIAKAARGGDSAHLPCNKLNGGRCAETDGCFDSGCTNPITTKEVVNDMKMKLEPVMELFLIIQADGTALWIMGSAIIFLEVDNLKGRRMLECAVIDGNGSRETLISLEYLNKCGIYTQRFH